MTYRLAPQVAFCICNGEPVFLDQRADRYFGLAGDMRATFLQLVAGARPTKPSAVEALVARGVIVTAGAGARTFLPPAITVPRRSLLDEMDGSAPVRLSSLPSAALSLARVLLGLKFGSLGESLALVRRRAARLPQATDSDGATRLSATFERCRTLLPVQPKCLVGSLALIHFLARRGHAATLVIGVHLNPFAAHCWVQTDDILLNEVADTASRYTPILVL